MEKWYSHSTKWEKDTVAIIHIYGARGSFILYYDDQDTESDEWEIKMSTSQLIFTHKNIPKATFKNYIHNL